jgi:cytochrome b
MTEGAGSGKIRLFVWDVPTRVFHWSLLALGALAWATAEGESDFWLQVHLAAGYGVLGLLVFRLVWGFTGTRHALFGSFVRPWHAVWGYTKKLAALRPPHSIGHNPLGGWMVILLLAMLAGVVVTGLFGAESENGVQETAGPLAHLVSAAVASEMIEMHEELFNILLILVGIHVAGVIADIVLTRDNLVRAMITGYKEVTPENANAGAGTVPYGRAAVAVAAALAAIWLVLSL